MAAGAERPFRIAHISDVHCGGPYFVPTLLERAIAEINDWQPDLVVCCGDLTTFGYKPEFAEARAYLDQIECESFVVIPGNHDSRNVGYVHFEEFFGDRNSVLQVGAVTVVAVDSTEPDLDHGRIGRGRYEWIEEQFSTPAELRVFVLHHHLLPVPGTGRERNIVYDAGDAIECLQRSGVDLVLSGHKHVPYAWRLEDMFIVNTGTVSTLRLRGNTRPCYNVIEVDGEHVEVRRRYPYHGEELMIRFSTRDARLREVDRGDRGGGRRAVRAVAVIDGEHYADVVRAALAELPYEFVAAVLVGGVEKLRGGEEYGVPLVENLDAALAYEPELVVDLSDEPVLPPQRRLELASRSLALGLRYLGPDFDFEPPRYEPFALPSLAVIGTGKRIGKTALTGQLARVLSPRPGRRRRRDGPRRPGRARADRGRADARQPARAVQVADVTPPPTTWRRPRWPAFARSGAGAAAEAWPGRSRARTSPRAPAWPRSSAPDLVVFDGSGAAIPPVATDRRILVTSGAQDVRAGLNAYRVLVSDLVVAIGVDDDAGRRRSAS